MKDEDRFAGLGVEALDEAGRESVVKLACEAMAEEVQRGPAVTGEWLPPDTCSRRRGAVSARCSVVCC